MLWMIKLGNGEYRECRLVDGVFVHVLNSGWRLPEHDAGISDRYGLYRRCTIRRNPKPVPSRAFDWDWAHDDYDGPPSPLCGSCSSPDACKAAIDEVLDDMNDVCIDCGGSNIECGTCVDCFNAENTPA